jgi:hypothetical protein
VCAQVRMCMLCNDYEMFNHVFFSEKKLESLFQKQKKKKKKRRAGLYTILQSKKRESKNQTKNAIAKKNDIS